MRRLADECVSAPLVARLREAGHDVAYVLELTPGAIDAEVSARAFEERRLLPTEDKDFGELVFRLRQQVQAIVILRTARQDNSFKWRRLDAAIDKFGETLFGRYTIIEETRFRSRPLLGATSTYTSGR